MRENSCIIYPSVIESSSAGSMDGPGDGPGDGPRDGPGDCLVVCGPILGSGNVVAT